MQIIKVNTLFETGFLRQSQILGDARRGVPGLIPVSATTWWTWVREGKAPKPLKLSPGLTVWRVEEIRAFMADLAVRAADSALPTRGQHLASARRRKRKGGGTGPQGGDEPAKDGQGK
jgi:predicted DNA-binding transcriptional regulator AlpA